MVSPQNPSATLPAFLTGTELYDLIMGQIDPQLLTTELEHTKEVMRDVSVEKRASMAKRFQAAFEEYDKQVAAYEMHWTDQFRAYKNTVMTSIEREQGEDTSVLESQISTPNA